MPPETDARELTERIGREVMGWRVHHRNTAVYVPAEMADLLLVRSVAVVGEWNPLTNPADDYRVLQRVRETFSRTHLWIFNGKLRAALKDRGYGEDGDDCPPLATLYEPGDYALAALKTLSPE